jgi:SAM-dependent methyltransferase
MNYGSEKTNPNRPIPSSESMKRVGAATKKAFISAGDFLTEAISNALFDRGFTITPETTVLDWGCGVGRVAFPLSQRFKMKLYGCDVDQTAIDFINKKNAGFSAFKSEYEPPLLFKDNFFDMVYAFSVFTHLPADAEKVWLKELYRITRPGALLLLSVIGKKSLEIHHARDTDKHVSWDDVEKKGMVFAPNPAHKKDPKRWPGVTGDYGVTAHHPNYIYTTWGEYFTKIEIIEAGAGGQDIVVCTR